MHTNVSSVVRLVTKLVQHFEHNGNEGGIMAVTSMAAIFPVPYQASYSGTKAFITNFMFALSQELTNQQLSLTIYAPGGIETEMTDGKSLITLESGLCQ